MKNSLVMESENKLDISHKSFPNDAPVSDWVSFLLFYIVAYTNVGHSILKLGYKEKFSGLGRVGCGVVGPMDV